MSAMIRGQNCQNNVHRQSLTAHSSTALNLRRITPSRWHWGSSSLISSGSLDMVISKTNHRARIGGGFKLSDQSAQSKSAVDYPSPPNVCAVSAMVAEPRMT